MDTNANVDDITLISGVGDREQKQLCVMSLTALLAGEEHTDRPVCACPVLTAAAIRLNDAPWWSSDEERTSVLSPLAKALVGTRDPDRTGKRVQLLVERALRVWAPAALESAARVHPSAEHAGVLRAHAEKLRANGSAAAAARYAAADAAADAAVAARYAADARRTARNQLLEVIYEAIAI